MDRYLSVDCGGTKTAFLLCDESGKKEAECILGPANYIVNGMDSILEILNQGFGQVCEQAGITQGEIRHCFIALAGYGDIPDEMRAVQNRICAEFPNLCITLGNDTENALAGSLLGKHGIHIIAGTGSIGIGLDEDDTYIRSGGWHHLFGGDEGSGYWIGCRLLQHFTKQADGREKKSLLYDYVMKKYRLCCPEDILKLVIEQWQGKREKIAALSQDVWELAEQEDGTAIDILEEAAHELAAIIKSVYDRGTFERPVKISYSGGVFKAMQYLKTPFEEGLAAIPHVLQQPQLPPVAGGIVLAMEKSGVALTEEMTMQLWKI